MENTVYQYTKNMRDLFSGGLSVIRGCYCREDLEDALRSYDAAGPDARIWRKNDLSRLCRATGVDMETLLRDRTLLDGVKTRAGLIDSLVDLFYSLFRETKALSPSAYMERLVRRLAPEYKGDTVRVAILKKFLKGAGCKCKTLRTDRVLRWAEERMDSAERQLSASARPAIGEIVLSKIDDSVFDPIDRNEGQLLTPADIRQIIGKLTEKHRDDAEWAEVRAWLATTAGDVRPEELTEESISALERGFCSRLKSIERVTRTGQRITANADYEQAKKDARKKIRDTGYKLLKMCNDLAAGNFMVNGETRKSLYYFAIMFGMKLYLSGEEYNADRDIVKNLFQDYYNDNLVRALSGSDPATENYPTGEGINFKNFAEAVYLYFICRDDQGLTPGEKIDRAEEIITKCAQDKGEHARTGGVDLTQKYREGFTDLLKADPDQLADRILKMYPVRGDGTSHTTSHMMAASGEVRATSVMDDIFYDLADTYSSPGALNSQDLLFPGKGIDDCSRKEIREDLAVTAGLFFDKTLAGLLTEKYPEDTDLRAVIDAINDRGQLAIRLFNKDPRRNMLLLLHVFAMAAGHTLSEKRLRNDLTDSGGSLDAGELADAMDGLNRIGYPVGTDDNGNYHLDIGEDITPDMTELLKKVSRKDFRFDEESDSLLKKIVAGEGNGAKRLTRSDFIILSLDWYIQEQLDEESGSVSFVDVYEDYAGFMDPHLEEARYQPVSEKNILDMYIVISIFLYLCDTRVSAGA